MEVSSDTIDEEHEDIEESLEDLLIFPTRKGLRRAMDMIEAYFVFETTIMKRNGFRNEDYQSTMEDQRHIIKDATNELNHGSQAAAASASTQLAFAFTRHAESFKDLYIDTKK